MSDHVRKTDGSRWGLRVIRPGGRVKWLGRWYVVEDGPTPIEEFERTFNSTTRTRQPYRSDDPKYDGRMDGMKAHFYTYGDHHEGSQSHIYLHSVEGAEWPGRNCISNYFVWESYVAVAPAAPGGGKEKS